MKIEELSVGDKYMIEVQIADRIEVEDVVQLSAIEGGLIWASVENLIPHNDKYKQALIDLYRSCVENRPSFPEHLEISEYNRAVSIFEDERTKSINHAISLGAELVEVGES